METAKTLGILGGGQLGRMSAQAAKKLGIRTVIYTPENNSPASQVADETIVAVYEDHQSLRKFSEKVDVISYEFENIPIETVKYLKQLKPVYPEESVLEVSQDRISEKTFLNSIGIPTTRWESLDPGAKTHENVDEILKKWEKSEAIIKTARFGYDGKGQLHYKMGALDSEAWRKLENQILIVEEIIDFDCEISVIIARDRFGKNALYGPMLNEHRRHILHKTTYPANIAAPIAAQATALTATLADKLNLRGVITLEMFVTKDGKLLANEIAPRTHNSGHWTIDACEASQFEQHVRTVCGLPVAEPVCHPAEMINLIGEDINDLGPYQKSGSSIHLYGKEKAFPGRKMGHVTVTKKS